MYIKANAANCLQVQLAAPEIMTEHRKSVKCQDFISTCVQMQEVMDGMAMCLQQWFAVGFLIGVLEPTRSRDAADCHQLSYQIIFKKFKKI